MDVRAREARTGLLRAGYSGQCLGQTVGGKWREGKEDNSFVTVMSQWCGVNIY